MSALTVPDDFPDRPATYGADNTRPKPCKHCLDGSWWLCTEHGAPSTLKAPRR